jgi:hypothetical protein
MSYLIQIDTKTNQVLHPEIMKLVDSFSMLDEKEMLYVALFTDYNSIYKQFPEHIRKSRAMWHAFNENEDELIKSPKILRAVEDYKSLQYNPKEELIIRFQKKIDSFLELLDEDKSPTAVQNTTKAIATLRDNIRELQYEVDEKYRADGQVKGDRDLSFIEKLISNKKQYLAVVAKK